MPLPVAHAFIGLSVAVAGLPKDSLKQNWKILAAAAITAIVPDFDFYFVWVLDLGSEWHRGFMHSMPVAIMVSLWLMAITKLKYIRNSLILGLALLSHGILDYLTTRQASGIELFYPFWHERLKLGLFGPFEFDHAAVISPWLKVISYELIVFGAFLLIVLFLKGYFTRSKPSN